MWVLANLAYLSILLCAVFRAAAPGMLLCCLCGTRHMCLGANGRGVVPLGRLLLSRIRLTGSLTAGISAYLITLHKLSWLWHYEIVLERFCGTIAPRGAGVPPFRLCSSLVHLLPHLLLFITFSLFPFLIHLTYFLLLSIRSLSTRIVLLCFQAWS